VGGEEKRSPSSGLILFNVFDLCLITFPFSHIYRNLLSGDEQELMSDRVVFVVER